MKKTSKNAKGGKDKKSMDLRDLLVQKINALYDIENELVKALPKMAKAASDENLKDGFSAHLEETKTHVQRLEEVSSMLGVKPKALKSEAIRGLVKDGAWVIKNTKPQGALDAHLARAAQYVEHYEIAGYVAAIDWAIALGETEVADILVETLHEEEAADDKLRSAGENLDKAIA